MKHLKPILVIALVSLVTAYLYKQFVQPNVSQAPSIF
jgi:hypothetical protein